MEGKTGDALSSENISEDETAKNKTQTLLLERLDLLPNSKQSQHSIQKIVKDENSTNDNEVKQHGKTDFPKDSGKNTNKRKGANFDSPIKCRKSNRTHTKIDYATFDSGIDDESLESVTYNLNPSSSPDKNKKVGRSCKKNTDNINGGETSVEINIDNEDIKEISLPETTPSSSPINSDVFLETAVKRKRGRPKKNSLANSSHSNESLECKMEDASVTYSESINLGTNNDEMISLVSLSVKSENADTHLINSDMPLQTVIKRKPGRPKKPTTVLNSSQNSECDNSNTNNNEMIDALTKPKEEIEENDDDIDVNISKEITDMITCAVCNLEMQKSRWTLHKNTKHNGLAWKIGENPIDLNDKSLVTHILNKLYKQKKLFTCENCGEKKKSVAGFQSHQLVCSKSNGEINDVKVKCELCTRTMLPVSMPSHMKLCHSDNKTNNKKNRAKLKETESNDRVDSPRSKRAAAVKANNLLQIIAQSGEIVDNTSEKEKSQILKHFFFTNFDFRSTFYLKRLFEKMLEKDKIAKCLFDECKFSSAQLNEILEHVTICDLKPKEGFTCKFCILTYKTKDDIEAHVKSVHSKSVVSENDNEYECVEEPDEVDHVKNRMRSAVKVFTSGKLNVYSVEFLNDLSRTILPVKDTVPYKWTLKFCMEHFKEKDLFQNFHTNLSDWPEVHNENLIHYMPMLDTSIDVTHITVTGYVESVNSDCQWKKYDFLESDVNENATTTFLGGPTQVLAWAPTPFTEENIEQIVAVVVLLDPDKKYYSHTRYNTPGMIQFWNCGNLQNREPSLRAPEFEFSLAHDYGIIWHMEWCPSGCYDTSEISHKDKLKRLGLLAVCCSDSFVYVYSIPQPKQIQTGLYKPTPVLKLQLQTHCVINLGKTFYHATKISWSKASEHKFVAVGYSNGIVALYNLKTTSKLLCLGKDENGIETLLPYKTFQAHYHSITALALFHLNNGCRWLMTGSVDRHSKFWDLENVSSPLTSIRKHVITDGIWLTNWICSIFAYDEASVINNVPLAVHQVRNFLSEITFILYSCSTVKSVTGSDWANSVVEGTGAGEVMGICLRQLLYKIDNDKSLKTRRKLFSYVNLVEKDSQSNNLSQVKEESPSDKRLFYNEAAQKYGMVFCDHNLDSYSSFKDKHYDDLGGKINKLRFLRPDSYPLQCVNNVAFNPNRQSYLYLATGYQAGFLRIRCLKFLDTKK